MPRPWTVLETVDTADGPLELRQRDTSDFMITIDGRVLMNSLANRSEVALGQAVAPVAHRARPRVLVGGLGMGYTLKAVLDTLPAKAEVVVVELNPVVEKWCRGPLAHLTDNALSDPRVRLVLDDVANFMAQAPARAYDAILLDLHEGPNQKGRGDPFWGIAPDLARHALKPSGLLAVWSEEGGQAFQKNLKNAGFGVELQRLGKGGRRHAVYLARPERPGPRPSKRRRS
ncbi:MAG: spermidine synthase [Vulcanimicrobiota bacterium]